MKKLKGTIHKIKPLDADAMELAKRRQDELTKPMGSLGVLEDLSVRIAGMQRIALPTIKEKVIVTMVGDHGVVEEGVSAYPKEVTRQMVYNFVEGGAAINVFAHHIGARVVVVDMSVASEIDDPRVVNRKVNYGTRNMVREPAMTKEEAIKSIDAGIEVVKEEAGMGMTILGIGDMGIGNTTASSAIVACITRKAVREVTGRGTGINDSTLENKVRVIEKALQLNKPDPRDPVDVLAKVGGFEIGGLAGAILAGAAMGIPVVLDGFITGAAALIAGGLAPLAKEYMIASHCSLERGHRVALEWLGLKPLLNLRMRLGEGTGAALGIFLAELACRILTEMATFDEARVSRRI